MSFITLPPFLENTPEDTLVLTYTQRLAMHTLEAVADLKKASDSVWETIPVRAFNYCLEQVWQRHKSFTDSFNKILLSNYQEQMVWKKVIKESPLSETLVNFTQTAKQASQAYKLVQTYGLDFTDFESDNNPDCRALAQWAKDFDAYCETRGYVCSSKLPAIVTQWVLEGDLALPKHLAMMGFHEHTPQLTAFLDAMKVSGVSLNFFNTSNEPGHARLTAYDSLSAECGSVIQSCIDDLHAGVKHIAIVAPVLETYHDDLYGRLFERLNRELPIADVKTSHPEQLSKLHLVSVAVKLISLPHSSRPLDEWGTWLRSNLVGIGIGSDHHQLADLIERTGREEFSARDVMGMISAHSDRVKKPEFCRDLFKLLASLLEPNEDKQTPARWVAYWVELLNSFNFCKGIALTQEQGDQYNSLMKSLQAFSGIGLVEGHMTRYQALTFFRSYIAQQMYHLKIKQPNVYLLSAADAIGMTFDKVYAVGFDDQAWPQPASPNPFVPVNIQRDQLIPHSSSERELHFAKMITQKLVHLAPEIQFSYSKIVEGVQLCRSPLLNEYKELEPVELEATNVEYIDVQWIEDNQGTPLRVDEKALGGSQALKQHSECPFKGYGKNRLHLREYSKLSPGLSYSDRGNMVHHALEHFWKSVKSSGKLHTLKNSGQLIGTVLDCVKTAYAEVTGHRQSLQGTRFSLIEIERVSRLLEEWLLLELHRPEFTVRSVEKTMTLSVGDLTLTLKLDRLDETEDGKSIIIDYKTGKCSPNQWVGDRPEDPQLPLYTLEIEKVAGVAFAALNAKSVEFSGVTEQEDILPGVKAAHNNGRLKLPSDWEQLLQYWRTTLEALAEDYASGNATVDPRSFGACRYCNLKAVCRVSDSSVQPAA